MIKTQIENLVKDEEDTAFKNNERDTEETRLFINLTFSHSLA